MAKQFLTGLDLNKNELLNARIQNLSTAPSSPVAGQIYFDTDDAALYLYDGSAWGMVASGGDVPTTSDDLTEGSNNLFYTTARAKTDAAALLTGASLTNITITGDGDGLTITAENGVADSDTDDLTEGSTNLYFTDARANTAAAALLTNATLTNITITGDGDGLTITAENGVADSTTDDLTEGSTNLYYTNTRARSAVGSGDSYIAYNSSTGAFTLDTANAATVAYVDQEVSDVNNTISALTTDDVAEGTDLYYTDARARAAVSSGDNTIEYNSSTGAITANTSTLALKSYVDEQVQASALGLDVKASVRVATTANITLENEQTIDNVAVVAGDRVLVKNQTDGTENGIYIVVDGGAWTRSTDADSDSEVTAGLFTFVAEGDSYADTGWVISTNDDITVGSTAITWTQFSGAGQYTAGDGLTLSGTTFAVGGTTDRISVSSDAIDISANYVGQTSITTVGTISAGTWNGNTVGVAYGGTGATTLASGEYLVGNGTGAVTSVASIPVADLSGTIAVNQGGTGATTAAGARSNLGATTKYAANNTELTVSSGSVSWTVNHALNTQDVVVQIRELSGDTEVVVDVEYTDANNVTLSWNSATTVAADSYRVVVIG